MIESPNYEQLAQRITSLQDGDALVILAEAGSAIRLPSPLVISSAVAIKFQPISGGAGAGRRALAGEQSPRGASHAARSLVQEALQQHSSSGHERSAADMPAGRRGLQQAQLPLVFDCMGQSIGIIAESSSVVLQNVAVVNCTLAAVTVRKPASATADSALTITDSVIAGNSGSGVLVELGFLSMANVVVARNQRWVQARVPGGGGGPAVATATCELVLQSANLSESSLLTVMFKWLLVRLKCC